MTEGELLEGFRGWLLTVASGFPPLQPSRVEELAQEGWISIWLAIKDNKFEYDDRAVEPYLKKCAINRMRDVFEGWTRQQRNVYQTSVVDMTPGEMHLWEFPIWTQMSAPLDEVASAYQEGVIRQAIDRLPDEQKHYVIRRFWYGWEPAQLAICYDHPQGIWRKAKKNLVKELVAL